MANSYFEDKSSLPDEIALQKALAGSYILWEELKGFIIDNFPKISEEWKHYGAKSGWVKKVYSKKRNLMFFTPRDGYFRVGMVFGDKAVKVILDSGLPQRIIDEISNARKYAEGRGIRIEAKSESDIENLKKLLLIKFDN